MQVNAFILKIAYGTLLKDSRQIKRLNSCVMSEEQVREIMKSQMHTVFKDIIEDATDKAIKVFADRLKEKIFKPWYFLEQIKFIKEDIDDLVKEMTGSCENAVVMGFDCREIEVIGGGDNE